MERFTHVHPILPLLIWTPVVVFLIWRSFFVHAFGFSSILGLGLLGLLAWTFVEYVMHRFVFHYRAKTAIGERMVYLMHGVHHDSPNDATRLVMPPIMSGAFAVLFFALFRGFFAMVGTQESVLYVEPFFAFFLMGYLCYDYIHFAVHHFKPHTALGRYLKQSHMNHHYVSPDTRWGVSTPLWDWAFGTLEVPALSKSSEQGVTHAR